MKKAFVFVLTVFLLLSMVSLLFAGGKQEAATTLPKELNVSIWAGNAAPRSHWRADNAIDAAKVVVKAFKAKGKEITINVKAVNDAANWSDYKRKFTLAAEDGQAPYIVTSGHEDIATWGQAGYIVPLANSIKEMQEKYPQFADVIPSLWKPTMWHGKVWAVPQDTEARPMYFSKTKLKKLGWTDAQIAALPDKIRKGEFTLQDLIKTAKEAVAKGVVPHGYGYWHRPVKGGDFVQFYMSFGGQMYDPAKDKLVIVPDALEKWYAFQRECVTSGITPAKYIGTAWNIWHDTVANDKVLFWNGGTWMWSDWVKNYAKGGEAQLFKTVGYALEPSGIKGKPGGTLSHPLVYMVTSKKASGDKYPNIMLQILANMTTKELNTRHDLASAHLAILKSQQNYAPYTKSKFLASVTYMLNYNYYQPNHVMYGQWFEDVWNGMLDAEQGTKSPSVAAQDTVKKLKLDLGDSLIVK